MRAGASRLRAGVPRADGRPRAGLRGLSWRPVFSGTQGEWGAGAGADGMAASDLGPTARGWSINGLEKQGLRTRTRTSLLHPGFLGAAGSRRARSAFKGPGFQKNEFRENRRCGVSPETLLRDAVFEDTNSFSNWSPGPH